MNKQQIERTLKLHKLAYGLLMWQARMNVVGWLSKESGNSVMKKEQTK